MLGRVFRQTAQRRRAGFLLTQRSIAEVWEGKKKSSRVNKPTSHQSRQAAASPQLTRSIPWCTCVRKDASTASSLPCNVSRWCLIKHVNVACTAPVFSSSYYLRSFSLMHLISGIRLIIFLFILSNQSYNESWISKKIQSYNFLKGCMSNS